MKCPKCKTKLIEGEQKQYETLDEHVFNPNKEDYPLRPTYICTNKNCEISKAGFYGIWGGFYGTITVDSKYWRALKEKGE